MSNDHVAALFSMLGRVCGICPCCDEFFYLSETRPHMEGTLSPSYIDEIRDRGFSLDLDEQELSENKKELSEGAITQGRTFAKEALQGLDLVFRGAGYDPRDAQLIFHPVSHVVFDGRSRGEVAQVVLVADKPNDSTTEDMQKSIMKTIESGNFEFKTLRIDGEGAISLE